MFTHAHWVGRGSGAKGVEKRKGWEGRRGRDCLPRSLAPFTVLIDSHHRPAPPPTSPLQPNTYKRLKAKLVPAALPCPTLPLATPTRAVPDPRAPLALLQPSPPTQASPIQPPQRDTPRAKPPRPTSELSGYIPDKGPSIYKGRTGVFDTF